MRSKITDQRSVHRVRDRDTHAESGTLSKKERRVPHKLPDWLRKKPPKPKPNITKSTTTTTTTGFFSGETDLDGVPEEVEASLKDPAEELVDV